MRIQNVVICDQEEPYGTKLAQLVAEREELGVQVQYCSTPEHARQVAGEQGIGLLLTGDMFPKEECAEIPAQIRIVLGRWEEGMSSQQREKAYVYRYQSGNAIVDEVIDICLQVGGEFPGSFRRGHKKLVGIYSPVHRAGKTSFAIGLGKELVKKDGVLYLNLETYGGVGGHFPREEGGSLADFFYYVRQEESNLGIRLSTMVRQMEGLDYLAPVPVSRDLQDISGEDWQQLMEQLIEKSIYGIVLLDLGEGIRGLWELLSMCDLIYMPVLRDGISQAKLRQYQKNLEVLGMTALEEKTRLLYLHREQWEQDIQKCIQEDFP